MFENIVIASGKQDKHYGFRFCWFGGSLETLLGHDVLNTLEIHNKILLCRINTISIPLIISHTS